MRLALKHTKPRLTLSPSSLQAQQVNMRHSRHTCDIFQWVESDLWCCLVWLPLGRGIENTVHEGTLGVVKHESPYTGQEVCRAATVGGVWPQVHQGQVERLQCVV